MTLIGSHPVLVVTIDRATGKQSSRVERRPIYRTEEAQRAMDDLREFIESLVSDSVLDAEIIK